MKSPQASQLMQHTSENSSTSIQPLSRRSFVGAAAFAGASLLSAASAGEAQTRQELKGGRTGNNASDPGPENKPLLAENPNSNLPPFTDHGNPGTL